MKPEYRTDLAWAAVLAIPAVYDAWALSTNQETLSAGMRRHTEKPWQKFMLVGALGGLAVHFLLPPIQLTERKGGRHDQA